MSIPLSKKYSTFSPQSIPGLFVWSDASQLSGTTGSVVVTIPNLGSGGTVSCTGTIYNAGRNGLNTVRLTASPLQTWSITTGLSFNTVTLFWVGRQTGGANARVLNSANGSYNELYGYWNGRKKVLYIDGNPNQLSGSSSDTNWDLMSLVRTTGGAFAMNWNGSALYSASSSTTSPDTFSINVPYEPSNCEFGEIIIYNTILTSVQIQQIEGYLSLKWSIQSILPVSHPYYNSTYMRRFLPTDISGCQLWLDGADATTTIGSTTNMSQWSDKSGNLRHLTPSFGTTLYTSNQYVQMNSGIMYVNTTVDLYNVTWFVTTAAPTSGQSNQPVFSAYGNVNTQLNYQSTCGFGFYMDTDSSPKYRVYGQYNNNAAGASLSNFTSAIQTPCVVVNTISSSGAMKTYLNGSIQSLVATSTARTTPAYGFTLGGEGYQGSLSTNTTSTKIYEIIVYNSVLTDAQRQQVEGYLAYKWSLNSLFPTTTPPANPPTGLGNCLLWYDAADSTSITKGVSNNITEWRDKSGNNNHLSKYSGATADAILTTDPGLQTNSVVYFPNGAVLANSKAISYTPGSTPVFVVARLTAMSSTNIDLVFEFMDDRNNSLGDMSLRYISSILFYPGNGGDYGYNIAYVNGSASPPTTTSTYSSWHLLYSPSAQATGSSRVSLSAANGSGRFFIGYIGEVIVFQNGLSMFDRQRVERYLATKWNLTIPDYGKHPFCKFPSYLQLP
jgi:hypothetical protein